MKIREIQLTRGLITLIDEADYEWVSRRIWHESSGGYATTRKFDSEWVRGTPRKVAMHRMMLNPPPGLEVDHINGNRLDNRRENLRLVTRSQNICNSRNRPNKWGLRGVYYHSQSALWVARITIQRKTHYLGYYKTAEEAHEAYKKAAINYHGEYARVTR